MGKKKADASGGQLHFDDFSDDEFEATTQVMANRTRFEALDPGQRARLAEHLVAMDITKLLVRNPDEDQVAALEDRFQEALSRTLDQVSGSQRMVGCYFCHSIIGPDEAAVHLHMTWMDDGRKVHSEPTDEIAHSRCVKRVREGGDPDAKPMF